MLTDWMTHCSHQIRRPRIRKVYLATIPTITLVIAWLLSATPAGAQPATLTIAAASDLTFALKPIVSAFQKRSGAKARVTFGSSGKLAAQIEQGAPFDLFLSADESYPARLVQSARGAKETLVTYALPRVVLWTPNGSGIDVEKLGVRALLHPAAKNIAIANPDHAPYGRAAMAILTAAGLAEQVKPRLVHGENVAQAAQFALTGNAQLAFVPLALALAPGTRDRGRYIEVAVPASATFRQTAVIVAATHHRRLAQEFLNTLTSDEGRSVLRDRGFRLPERPQ